MLTLYRYILAYRSIFCNDIYPLEVCTNEAVQLMKEACWKHPMGALMRLLFCGVVWNPLSIPRKKNHSIFLPTLNSFFLFQFTKYAQLFMDFCSFFLFLFLFFFIPWSFIKMPAINSIHGVSFHILVLIDSSVMMIIASFKLILMQFDVLSNMITLTHMSWFLRRVKEHR